MDLSGITTSLALGGLYVREGGWQVPECGHSLSLPSWDLCVLGIGQGDGTEASERLCGGGGVTSAGPQL